ncbi:LysM peptidoglycan-binding domain-containing protein [Aliivibrio sifiae]|uniref:LysM domain-containing protein n=1 Tax=Aliivibrio sifiae TaxID=566293 RepID=A0A2S7XB80_9GAMM|nr:LysM domain-containing protein [Aliivibrio sifiae]PQJ88599.1 hypothetical protein BTO22_02975 [Aliivibrio sifiae]
MSYVTKLICSIITVGFLFGCASSDDAIDQQKQNTSKIDELESKISTLELELQKQQETDEEITEAVNQLGVEQEQAKSDNQDVQEVKTYLVNKNDTLSKIAIAQGMELEDIINLNPQVENPNYLSIGEEINIK